MHRLCFTLLAIIWMSTTPLLADGPQDNSIENVRPVPPLGIELTNVQIGELNLRLKELTKAIQKLQSLKSALGREVVVAKYLPDVLVLHRAVKQAVRHQEMFHERDIKTAHDLLDMAFERAAQLAEGKAPWTRQTGLVVRGFISELDGTVQPYGLEIAENYNFEHPSPVRCDIWFHGRGERSMELHFISQRARSYGQYRLNDGIVLHPYGRYSNAFKFAGEVDTLEALEHVKQNYNIDEDRISVRGFSMGGAGCWQFAVHYTDQWFAANPGAGFSETPRFLKSFQGETLNPPWYEEKLWRMYDCDHVAENLRHVPTIAYSGEIDKQKQAADVMEEALKEHNIELMHVIGPNTAHKTHPDSNVIIQHKMDHLAARGREKTPTVIDFTTYTLKYNRMNWVTIHGLQEHWERSHIEASIIGNHALKIDTSNVTEFSIDFPSGASPFDVQNSANIRIDGQATPVDHSKSDLSFHAHFHRDGDKWKSGRSSETPKYQKKNDLQGPIDDALMTPFLFVKPSEKSKDTKVEAWVNSEMNRAVKEWRRHMRGDVRIKADTEVTADDIASYNLILWGTPESNSMMEIVADKLPILWTDHEIKVGEKNYATENHVPVLIHPNPLNPQRYIVFNSSFTYREYDYLNNARQTPKLPDWAIINVDTPPNSRWPGKIIDANFFDEQWKIK